MKIAILSFYSGVNLRGVEVWAKLLKEKIDKDFDVEIISGSSDESILSNLFSTYRRWISADVIVPTNGRDQSFFVRLASWLKGKPVVIFGHSGLGADDKWNLLCSPNVFVAFSSHQKRWAEKFKLPWTKVVLIPHAVDTKRFSPGQNKRRDKTVLCVAANTASKRVDLVRRAVDLIPGSKFMAVGRGNSIEAKYSEMPEIYRNADVFCFTPNPWEAFGLVFLEAMAANLPVVTTNDPIRREIVGDAGIFVDNPENSEALAEATGKALETNWGDRPRKQAEKFDWDKIAKQYEELFKQLVQ